MSTRRFSRTVRLGLAAALLGAGGMVYAQIEGDRGAAPIDSSGSFEVSGIDVDVRGEDAESAREAGWRLAQRLGWRMLAQRLAGRTASLSDSALNGVVTGIVIENEQIGPERYIARLGVLFDRGRAGRILGVSGQVRRSPPMLVVPVQWSGGVGRVFERTTPWQEAWARFRTGNSSIDYVRPRGTGADPLLMNAGQTGRRGRGWWREVLDSYGAEDVLIPEVQLIRSYPGGPITGIFTASHGPDRQQIARFALRVNSGDALGALLDAGVERIDRAYQNALASGVLETDALLAFRPPEETEEPEAEESDEAEASAAETPVTTPTAPAAATYSVQVDTPSAQAVTASESAVRGIPGVRSASTTSVALGGISVLRVSYEGSIASLRSALEARGWSVQEGAGVLRIRRGGTSTPPPPPPSAPEGDPAE
ncbi:heavy-metal-associated domain-containing protein [Sphingosinithalassobacter sp. LHW66-3]|uniref:heavy-metal-associated domain-containing protein n=1 Tax=Sphingosinithalassobacter sp. LHW66-3 TaxID=3424718 RepID=UPI003D6B43B7